jgi:tetratricopeptide (TPR) repeat protein
MSEMLGNQYFLARKYSLAADELEKALSKNPTNKGIRRKLIICEIQKGNINKALDLFASLVEDDVAFIIDADPIRDDCPCPELVYDMEEQFNDNKDSIDYYLKLAMIWLYCDVNKSLHYFNLSMGIDLDNGLIKKIIYHLSTYLLKKE